ncbi:hypothetical protein LCGC14_1248320 [marine sediment metagenome]|uniref:APS kinase domain-containing protein n=1 Tax=marine sediment metagenome TaxID=412755 RepID=A0A0F9P7S0_9ZZZZ
MENKGFTLWFTGLPYLGKTVLVGLIAEELEAKGMKVEDLDGNIVKKV